MRLRTMSLACFLVAIAACDSTSAPQREFDVASISVSLGVSSMSVGATVQAVAIVRDASGNDLAGRPVSWASTNPDVASVSSDGRVATLTPGFAAIVATSQGRSGTGVKACSTEPRSKEIQTFSE